MFHSILEKSETGYNEAFSWPLDDYIKFCEYLSKQNEAIDFNSTNEIFLGGKKFD